MDGDRERIPYEADAYLNQLSHYATDRDVQMARDTFDRLMKHPTWPTEWASHMVFMAHADWMHTGDSAWLSARYESLKPKLLLERAREDGLLVSGEAQRKRDDIVDWPAGERDGYVFTPVNTVVNAFHLRSLALMAELAAALGRDGEAADYRARERKARAGVSADAVRRRRAASTAMAKAPTTRRCTRICSRWRSAWCRRSTVARRGGVAGQPRDGVFGLRRAVPAGGAVRDTAPAPQALALMTAPTRPQLAAHGRERHHHHLGGLGPEVQAEPGLEPRVGRRARQPAAALRARRETAGAGMGRCARASSSWRADAGVRQGADATRSD